MKRLLSRWLWRYGRDWLLDRRDIRNHTILQDREFLDLLASLVPEGRVRLTVREIFNLHRFVRETAAIDGDIAEVGVYRGGSARVICEGKGSRVLHLFDTFGGMPDVNPDIDLHRRGDFADTSIGDVRDYLKRFDGVQFHKGWFPESARPLAVAGTRFSLVHLDVDIYESTLRALEFFYPRMSHGGVLVSHDYRSISCPGVREAVDEFFRDKPERVFELWDTQCAIVRARAGDP
jgi:hypothetical protein